MGDELPLTGVRVLDAAGFLAGPYCAMVLADLGATVLKVESLAGDLSRTVGEQAAPGGVSVIFCAANRGKRSVALDLRSEDGRRLLRELALACDVVIHNHFPAHAAKLGIDHGSLRAIKPELVVANVTAFGEQGPYASRGALDPAAQAMAGMMAVTGPAAGPPMRAGPSVVDFGTGMTLATAVLAALLRRERTGAGAKVTASLLEVAMLYASSFYPLASVLGHNPPRLENRSHPLVADQFAAGDGFVVLAFWDERRFAALCELLGAAELADDPRFASNELRLEHYGALRAALQERISRWSAAELVEALVARGIPCAQTYEIDQVFEDPHIAAIGALYVEDRLGRPLRMAAGPMRLDDHRPPRDRPPPRLGQHTGEVLAEVLGLNAATVDTLRAAGAIGQDDTRDFPGDGTRLA